LPRQNKTFHARKAIRAERSKPKKPQIPSDIEAIIEDWIKRQNEFSLRKKNN